MSIEHFECHITQALSGLIHEVMEVGFVGMQSLPINAISLNFTGIQIRANSNLQYR